jgi:hypothetical protein
VRPEDLVPADEGAPPTVRRVVNLGHHLQVVLDCPRAGHMRMFTEKTTVLAEGQAVRLAIVRALAFYEGGTVEIGGPARPAVPARDAGG